MSQENIFLFVPNLIGYTRIFLALLSFYFMPFDHVSACWCYAASGLLDAVDGYAARYLNQSSKFGAILDQLTDRCSNLCLLVVLCHFYPRWMFFFQLSMVVDISSHWIHVQVSEMKGNESHKKMDLAANPILKHYYTNRIVLFSACAGNEMFYLMLYLIYFSTGPSIGLGAMSVGLWTLLCLVTAPIALIKFGISLVQLYAACLDVGAIDLSNRGKTE